MTLEICMLAMYKEGYCYKELNMRQRRWIELITNYECKIRYHPRNENVVAAALRRKGRVKSRGVSKVENATAEMLRGLDQLMERKEDKGLRVYCNNPRYPNGSGDYWTDVNMHVPLEEIKVHKTLCFVEEPVEIIDRKVKSLKRSSSSIVKACWDSKQGHEDFMRTNYSHLLIEQVIVGSTV
nr:putative reverse transcriptase domain-containing protein [Tanacetum cinerariifolium]